MTADECDALLRETLEPMGVAIDRQDLPSPVVYAAKAQLDGRHWHFVVMPKDDPEFVRLMARNAATAFRRGLATQAA